MEPIDDGSCKNTFIDVPIGAPIERSVLSWTLKR